jgi:hypothetical protein
MHDYHPIISRAVSRLERNTPQARLELFARIRKILIEQLRIQQPSPTESDLRRERAALEKAIRQVELEYAASCLADRPSVNRSSEAARDTEGLVLEYKVAKTLSQKPEAARHLDATRLESIQTGSELDGSDRDQSANKATKIHQLEALYERMQVFLTDQRQQGIPPLLGTNENADALSRTEPGRRRPGDAHDMASVAAGDQRAAEALGENRPRRLAATQGPKEQLQRIPSSRLSDLFAMRCLDRLLRGGAEQWAPESLRSDAITILNWLAMPNAEDIQAKHYEQFTRGLRAYMAECEEPSTSQATTTCHSSLRMNDEIRGVFARMLEREQAGALCDDLLAWFARIWIGLMLALNLIVGVFFVLSAPTLGAGFSKLASTYSPWDFGCWFCQLFAFAPAVIAIYVRRERQRERELAYSRTETVAFGGRGFANTLRFSSQTSASR